MNMTKTESTPLNRAVWAAIESPPKNLRKAMMRQLRAMPQLIRMERDPAFLAHYRVSKGPLWTQKDPE